MTERADVVIAGAGAAGLMAAIFAGRTARERGGNTRIFALDGAKRIGAKILISGGGRCNVTHERVEPTDFHGNRNSIAKILRSLSVAETRDFFESLGVRLKREDTGKLFPISDRAATVLDALLGGVREAGVEIRPATRVLTVRPHAGAFHVGTSAGVISCTRVILSTGGQSVPKTGSDGFGYEMVSALGHSVTPVFPALVPLLLPANHWAKRIKGVSCMVALSLRGDNGRLLERVDGSMLMTHFGISGPAVLDMSRHWVAQQRIRQGSVLDVSFLPGKTLEDLEREWLDLTKRNPRSTAVSIVGRWLPDRLAEAIVTEEARVDGSTMLSRLDRDSRKRLLRALTATTLPVTGDRGFDYAEVTAGGVPLNEVSTSTMESRIAPGLFVCGEILDVDGRIGGFNFQWAWATGRLAGIAAVRGIGEG